MSVEAENWDDLLNPAEEADEILDNSLRPKTLNDYIGQSEIKDNLVIFISAAKKRGEPIEHLLLYGPPGLGKTTLAHVIAKELEVGIKITSGPAIQRTGDLVAVLTNLSPGDILFIDEIHRLSRTLEEVLYTAMEDFAVDLILGKGPSAKTMRIGLPKFTLIGATTKFGSLTSPLRDRFGVIYRLNFYNNPELEEIIKRSSNILTIEIEDQGVAEIAKRARKTPRIANRILKRVRDYAEVKYRGKINSKIAEEAIEKLGIDQFGLDRNDKDYLNCIADKFEGGPVGLETIAAAISEDKDTIEDVIEPYLIQLGFINRTPRGRVTTSKAHEYLNIKREKKPEALF